MKIPKRNVGDKVIGGNSNLNRRTLLIDGNSLFKTSYFGAKGEYNHKGEHIGGVYQFLISLRKLLNEKVYDHVFVFWDGKFGGRLRYNIYPNYKIGRGKDFINGTEPEDKQEVLEQYMVKEYLEELFIRQLDDEEVEADDFIAHYVNNKHQDEQVVICSNDRDLCQLISDTVSIYISDFKTYISPTNYSQYFKHYYKNLKLIKILGGDDSDSILGVDRVRENTLLKHFPSLKERKVTLDEILSETKKLKQERLDSGKKSLKIYDNILNRITKEGVMLNLYEINKKLIDLSNPFLTKSAINNVSLLIEGNIDSEGRTIKNVYFKLKRDGIDRLLGEKRMEDFLTPFKKLINREKK